jgi:hypothetical protein
VAAVSEQLDWEARWAKPAAACAFAYAALSLASLIYLGAALDTDRGGGELEFIGTLDDQPGPFVVSAAIQALSLLVLAPALVYLYGAVKGRRPETPTIVLYLAVAGPVLLAIGGVLSQLDRIDNAEQFFASGARTEERAEDLLVERSPLGLGFGLAGALAFGFALVLLNVNAMRAGLESRFMGVVGVLVGALPVLASLLPVASGGFVQLFWVVALGFLFLGRWPGGRGPAWETGQATPWPSAADARLEAAEESRTEPEPPAGEGQPSARRRKKKRKR